MQRSQGSAPNGTRRRTGLIWLVAAGLLALPTAVGMITYDDGAAATYTSPALTTTTLVSATTSPEPIVMETLTGRSVLSDSVSFDLTIGLQDGEEISMSVTDPGRSVVGKITIQPGARFPWHTHPGPIFVNVAEGELVYIPASDCMERHYPAGSVFVDPGRGNAHTAYNASDGVTILIATFFEVPEEGPLTITEGVEAPAGCEVEVGVHQH